MVLTEMPEVHDTLNPKLWDGDKLKSDVREAALEVADTFMKDLEIQFTPVDILLLGSNASYNYTDHSDLDLHLVANYDLMDASPEIVQAMYNSARAQFNKNYDITIKGIGVELYVEDVHTSTISNGIYSVMHDEWIKYPLKIEVPDVDLEPELSDTYDMVNEAIAEYNLDAIDDTINELYRMRKNSIAVDGEYGKGNLIFKEIRNAGLLDELKVARLELLSSELSLESLKCPIN